MSDILLRKVGRTGRVTFNRPKALNALNYQMCLALEEALDAWATDEDVQMLVIDASGDRAFCAGGDIGEIYATGTKGDFAYGQKFWADEYRMNAKMFEFPKPVAAFMQGFTMGGGVGVGGHASHRVVGDSSQISMPECGIGLVPDVGGSYLLAHAPGRLGEYLGLTATRMKAADAIYAGFADYYIPESDWPDLITALEQTGDHSLIDAAAQPAGQSDLAQMQPQIDACFGGATLRDILNALQADDSDFAKQTLKTMSRNSPLAMACTVELLHRNRAYDTLRPALQQEYRYTYRALEHSDFLEGIRAAIIDKDRSPRWRHQPEDLPPLAVTQMLMPLGDAQLTFEKGE
ncbi:enoyl-CoA hydratase/isomerase family protein [Cognatishimia maritima]|uniref:3-hydroxyisobutyryl-CoA hydrolase n=1 Tax=Cognatishimia maritima TaxID=870908 RepID=A0A1M5JDX9_9RHOB|nr:enoyl-CoA hydratase/isomerase family protein [Cognatishimia maritima]SHG38470.1 Enoyl-CoA hydratase/carnithine racemase [Cognatishimia maritima]